MSAGQRLTGKKIAFLIGPQFQDEEGTQPKEMLEQQGADATYIGIEKTTLTGKYGRRQAEVEKTVWEVDPEDFDALVIPGGLSPKHLRTEEMVLAFVREFAETGRPLAAICHGPQVLISAGLVKGRTMTGYHAIKDELEAAGVDFVDRTVVIDGNFITSRQPADIPAFANAIADALTMEERKHVERTG